MSDESHTHTFDESRAFVIPVSVSSGGISIGVDGLPDELTDMVQEAMEHIRVDMMRKEIREFVTPQIAEEVLSAYGNEEATPPSLSTQSLITLIRTCHISDHEMRNELSDVEAFHGYVLAICMLAESEGDHGMAVLRSIADLMNDDDRAEMERMKEAREAREK